MNDLVKEPSQENLLVKKPFKARAFKDMKSWQLAVLGCISVFASSLTAYFLGHIWPLYVEAINASEVFSLLGLIVSVYLAGIGLMAIVFTSISKRCGELLYQRHLD